MAKMKVYELAKELDKQSKEILTFLGDKGVEVKSHMSTIEDDAVKMVKEAFGTRNTPEPEKKEASGPEKAKAEMKGTDMKDDKKQERPQSEGTKSEAPRKKKNIIFVSNPHNSKMGGQKQNNNGGNNNRP